MHRIERGNITSQSAEGQDTKVTASTYDLGAGCVVAAVVVDAAGVAAAAGASLRLTLWRLRAERSALAFTAASTRPLSLPFSASMRSKLKMKGT